MNIQTINQDKTVAALTHLSTFSKYIIPLGNFIMPLIFWTAKKEDRFVDEHGKQALNFQISTFLYFIILLCIGVAGIISFGINFVDEQPFFISEEIIRIEEIGRAVPFLFFIGIIATLLGALFILEIVCVITATIKASEGKLYYYPITINFIKPTSVGIHQSKNDQFNNTQNETL